MEPNVVAVSDKSGVDDAFTEDNDDKRLWEELFRLSTPPLLHVSTHCNPFYHVFHVQCWGVPRLCEWSLEVWTASQ
jgi:hypothetical protein